MRMIKGAFSSPSLSGRAAQRLARSLNSFHPTTDPALACALLQPSKSCRMVRVGVCFSGV